MDREEVEIKLGLVRSKISVLEATLEKEKKRASKEIYDLLVEQASPELEKLRGEESRYLSELARYDGSSKKV